MQQKRGQTLVELLMAVGIASLLLPALIVGIIAGRNGKPQQYQRQDAVDVLEQMTEAMRTIRETAGWNAFAVDGVYHPIMTGTTWMLTQGATTSADMTSQITIGDVYRNANGTIVSTPGTLDVSTKIATASVSWTQPSSTSIQSTMYFTRYMGNLSAIQTTFADFSQGTTNGTAVEYTNNSPTDGDVKLGPSGNGDWCNPSNFLLNPPLVLPSNTTADTISASTGGNAYIGFSPNAGVSTIVFAYVKITQYTPTVQASIQGVFYGTFTVYNVFGDGHYAYLATDSSGQEGMILDLTQLTPGTPYPTYPKVGWFTSGNGTSGRFVFVNGNTGYLVHGNTLSAYGAGITTYNLQSKTGLQPPLSAKPNNSVIPWIQVRGLPHAAYLSGNYLYIGSQTDAQDHGQIFDLTDPAQTYTKYVAWPNTGADINQLYVDSSGYLYTLLGFSIFSGQQFQIFDTTNKSNWTSFATSTFFIPCDNGTSCHNAPTTIQLLNPLSTTDAGMNTSSFAVVDNRLIVAGNTYGSTTQGAYKVYDVTNKNAPSLCGQLSGSLASIRAVTTTKETQGSFAYILTADSGNSFKIVQGGPGGLYASTGTFASSTMPTPMPNLPSGFNFFTATVSQPASTSAQLQVGVSSSNNGSCAGVTYTYLGPYGNPNLFFTPTNGIISGAIPFGTFPQNYQNPGQCFGYKVTLSTTNANTTPTFNDITINYSP